MHRVLVVDDERALAQMVDNFLTRAGYEVTQAHTGPEGLELARSLDPDVIVLDLGLPGLDGLEVCRQARTFTDCYILMLTARGAEVDRVIGLSVGADDYITKPFSVRELVARVQAVLRRPRRSEPAREVGAPAPARVFGDLVLDVDGREVTVAGRPIELTRTEFDVLCVLSSRPSMAFNRRQILDEVWDPGWVGDEHIVDVHVAHLRRKLGDDAAEPRYVATIRGIGYRMGRG
jgi:DNA-binding response OmpR family regulator